MIEKILMPLLAPFRRLRSQWMGVKNIKANLEGDVGRVKSMAARGKQDVGEFKDDIKGAAGKVKDVKGKVKDGTDKAKGAADKAKGAAGQAQGAVGQAQGAMQQARGPGGAPAGAPPPGKPGQAPAYGAPGAAPGGYGPPGGAPGGYGAAPGGGGGYAAPAAPQKTMAFMVGTGSSATVLLLGWLIPLKGPHRGELHTMKTATVIGKEPGCDVVFNDAFMSSRHATIRAQNGVFILEDHSTNGTFVNEKKVKTHELVDNDFIKFGQTVAKFKCL